MARDDADRPARFTTTTSTADLTTPPTTSKIRMAGAGAAKPTRARDGADPDVVVIVSYGWSR
jgi:hypothetical protein